MNKTIAGILVFLFLIIIWSCYSVVSPGNAGVVFNKWSGEMRSTPQGIVWRTPFVTTVRSYPTALRTYTMVARSGEGSSPVDDSLDLPTLEGQHIRQDLSVTYNTDQASAANVFRSFRGADIEEIEKTFIRRTVITIAQNTAGRMSLSEIISSKRNKFQNDVQETLSAELSKMGFFLDKVNLGASHLPESLEAQMQKKMAAQQEAQQAEYDLLKAQTLAKAEVVKAQGEANAKVIRAKSEAESNKLLQITLTQNLIQYQAVQKWNGALPIIASGATPFVDIKQLMKENP